MSREIIIVDQFFHPDNSAVAQLLTELSIGLQLRGWQLRVVTSRDEYVIPERPSQVDPESLGIAVWRVPRLVKGPIRRLKLLRQLWFCLAATVKLLFTRPPDLYVVQTTPPLIPLCVAWVAGLRRRPFVIIAQDLYPEMLAAHGMLDSDSMGYRLLQRFIDSAYRSANKVISLGPFMTHRLLDKRVNPDHVKEISNWAIGDLEPWVGPNNFRQEWGLERAFVILYSGNMGLGHEFATFLEGAKMAKQDCEELQVVFVGGGGRLEEIKKWVHQNCADNWVQFRPYQPQDVLRESLGIANLALITMRQGWQGLLVPSKLIGIMAMGLPTLYVGPESDVSSIITRFSAGIHVQGDDIESARVAIIEAVRDRSRLREMGLRARIGYLQFLHKDQMLDEYNQTLESVLDEKSLL